MAAGVEKPKRSFELRMSKKVAELTQVVHMLFTRNHEKEVEIEALKEAYEFEITQIVTDAKCRICALEKQQEEKAKQEAAEREKTLKLLEEDCRVHENECRKKLEESERLLRDEQSECQKLRDMLIHSQKDIEKLRQGASEQLSVQADATTKHKQEIDRLRAHILTLEHSLKDSNKKSSDIIRDLERSRDRLERDLQQQVKELDDSHRARDQLLVTNKQLEVDMKSMKRDFNRKVADVINGQNKSQKIGPVSKEQSEEVERLRQEIQRYRLELSNRDTNFNRMFTEKQPIHVDRSLGTSVCKLQTSNSPSASARPHSNSTYNTLTIRRERTLSQLQSPINSSDEYAITQFPGEHQRSHSTPRLDDRITESRLPSISSSLEQGQGQTPSGISKLAKPKPLPKEILFGK